MLLHAIFRLVGRGTVAASMLPLTISRPPLRGYQRPYNNGLLSGRVDLEIAAVAALHHCLVGLALFGQNQSGPAVRLPHFRRRELLCGKDSPADAGLLLLTTVGGRRPGRSQDH